MAKAKKNKASTSNTIAQNKRARFDYHIEEKFEAGLVLNGWEAKSLRAGKAQLTDTYVTVKNEEVWLLGCHISPLDTASTHVVADPIRTRKLLLNRREISKILGAIQRKGMSCIALALYWKKHLVKCEIALVQGKAKHDKRAAIKDREWNLDKRRLFKQHK